MLREHTEKLAKLMAGEDIDVIQKNAPTAYFDLNSRRLVLPNWKNLSVVEEEMLVGHEIGHALYTPSGAWIAAIDNFTQNKVVFKNILNIVEDARIEAKVKSKYPGMRKIFYYGYEELWSRGVFNITDADKSDYNLIDQLNFNFKIPGKVLFVNHPRLDDYIEKIINTVTFDDVVKVSQELYQHCEEDYNTQQDSDTESRQSTPSEGEPCESEPCESEPCESEPCDKFKKQPGSFELEYGESKLDHNKILVNDDPVSTAVDIKYIPEVNLKSVIIPYNIVIDLINNPNKYSGWKQEDDESDESDKLDFTISPSRKNYNKTHKPIIDYYSKLFDMKKQASQYKKTLTFRSGKLDMNKLINYKFDDKIFSAGQIKLKGKNHGLVLFLDMSQSMSRVFRNCITQLLDVITFCRNSGIPTSVYGFTSNVPYNQHRIVGNEPWYYYKNDYHEKNKAYMDKFALIEMFAPTMSTKDHNTMVDLLLSGKAIRSKLFKLGETPLIAAVLCLEAVVNKIKTETKSEIINVVFLTDGGDTCGYTFRSCQSLVDPKTKMKISKDDSSIDCTTVAILELMKKRLPGVNIVNFHISAGMKNLTKIVSDKLGFDETYYMKPDCFEINNIASDLKHQNTVTDINNSYVTNNKIIKEKQIIARSFIDKIC